MIGGERSVVSAKPSSDRVHYLVLEARQNPPVVRSLYEQAENPNWVYLFAETDWQQYLAEGPVVVQAAQDSELYKWALKELKLNNGLSGIVIESDEAMNSVVDWARERLTVGFDGSRRGLLRFYDPLVWHRLNPRNIGEQGLVRQVIYWHGSPQEGRWLVSRNPEPVTMAGTPVLEPEQLRRLGLPVVEPSRNQLTI